MISGYVAVLPRDSPLSDVTILTTSCRKATIRLVLDKDTRQFSVNIKGTDYCFKMRENVRTVDSLDSCNTVNSVLRVGFISPNLDLVIYGNTEDLEAFVYTVEAVKEPALPLPPECSDSTHKRKLSCMCVRPEFSQYQRYHRYWYCPMSASRNMCAFCCYRLLQSYNGDDVCKIINTWRSVLRIYSQLAGHIMKSVSVTSYPYLRELTAEDLGLVEIPEQLGSLPCLVHLDLSCNRLGQATNWNWLTSPFLRENLSTLWLNNNELLIYIVSCVKNELSLFKLSAIPEPVVRLRNLKRLELRNNVLTELPAALGNLKNLRELDVSKNKLNILHGWMYRKEAFHILRTWENDFNLLHSTKYRKPQLCPGDFETVSVPSLYKTVVKYIITERVQFWEYEIRSEIVNLLEAAYLCRCGSVVFRDTDGRTEKCRIKRKTLTVVNDYCYEDDDDDVAIVLTLCSYDCYQLIEPFMTD